MSEPTTVQQLTWVCSKLMLVEDTADALEASGEAIPPSMGYDLRCLRAIVDSLASLLLYEATVAPTPIPEPPEDYRSPVC